jgi:hypothetical protein
MFLAGTLDDPFGNDLDGLRRTRYGTIEVRDGQLYAISWRLFPKLISGIEADWFGRRARGAAGESCSLYYDQPRGFPNFLAIKFVVGRRDCTYATFRRAHQVLDRIARVKRSDALLCDVWNSRISDRLLARWGWEPHKPQRWHRNYIKRFYGTYTDAADDFEDNLALAASSNR